MHNKVKIISICLLLLVAVGACSSKAGQTSTGGKGSTITLWAMQDDLSTTTLNAINRKFTQQTGAKVNVQIQQWDGFETKLPTALATSNPPDVIDIGNTQVSSYAATGGLLDLTDHRSDLQQGQTWLDGLLNPALIDGHLYAVPSFAGDRAVIYNKKIWSAAGITTPPATYASLTHDLDKIKSKHSAKDFSALYLPAENWIASMQWVWDQGGQIATKTNGKWRGGMSLPQAQRGLQQFKQFQNSYSTPSSRLVNADKPDQDTIFADGHASAILSTSGSIATIEKDNPSLSNSDIGVFPMPGLSGRTQTVMLGGSDWGIAAKSRNQDLALKWIKIASGPTVEGKYIFGHDGWIPNSQQQLSKAKASGLKPQQAGFFTAAEHSAAPPAAADWTTIQNDNSLETMFGDIAAGKQTTQAAAQRFDTHLEAVLNNK